MIREFKLDENEKLLWSGRPEPFELKDKTHKSAINTNWVISTICFLAATIGFLFVSQAQAVTLPKTIVCIVVFFFIAASVMLRPVSEAKEIRNSKYFITDKRIVIEEKYDFKSLEVNSEMPCQIKNLDNGTNVIYIGSAVNTPMKKTRYLASAGSTTEDGELTGLILYSVKDGRKIITENTPLILV